MKNLNLLITYFEPFDGFNTNSSEQVVTAFMESSIANIERSSHCLPVSFERSWPALEQKILKVEPDIVIACGQAEQRSFVSLERVALNLIDASRPDNEGLQPQDEAILEGGPNAHFTSLPIKPMMDNARNEGFPVEISNTAGTYVCNYIMYKLLDYAHANAVPSGFIHLPLVQTSSAQDVGLPLEVQTQTLKSFVETIIEMAAKDR